MGKMPSFWKGRMRTCAICGFFYGELSGKIIKDSDGKWKCIRTCIDTLDEKTRAEQIVRR
jgi:hypothetical protein